MKKLRVLDLFSGIGGFSLGLERTGGFETVAFCEIEPFCRKVLNKHWPKVPIYEDVKTLTAEQLRTDGIAVDVICGGFPCQDISVAGKGAGIEGERSGLWSEYARIIGELRPRYVIVENVAALLSRGLDRVLGDLAALGFDAEWHCIPASAVGAPHRRDRVWIMAHSRSAGWEPGLLRKQGNNGQPTQSWWSTVAAKSGEASASLADTGSSRLSGSREFIEPKHSAPSANWQTINAVDGRFRSLWLTEPNVGRVANGVPLRVDRLKSLGNAVVPAIPELIGHAILESEGKAR